MKVSHTQHQNIGEVFTAIARQQKGSVAVIEAATGKSATFGEMNEAAASYVSFFKSRGLRSGDRVMLMVTPSIDFYVLCFSLFKLGVVIILIDPGMGLDNLKKCIKHVSPDAFIGIPKAVLFRRLFSSTFKTVKQTFCCGFTFGLFGSDIRKLAGKYPAKKSGSSAKKDDLAAIIFTSGSTGIPKGVLYHHSTFLAQLRLIRDYYGISHGDVDLPAFPLFGLFSTALGAKVVIPDMDSTKPAKVDPRLFVEAISRYEVSYSFGSPALWRVVAAHCEREKMTLDPLRLVLIAGAPVPGWLVEQVESIVPKDAELHTPYGATESLPIVSMSGREIVRQTWPQTRQGKGICVGRVLPDIDVKVIPISDGPIPSIDEVTCLGIGEIGEIIVKGDVVTSGYDHLPGEDDLAKIKAGPGFYHRMGDTGYIDEVGRLWFCGRKSHRVETCDTILFPICCEAITNEHLQVYRSALVGIADPENSGFKKPVIIVEPEKQKGIDHKRLLGEVRELAAANELTHKINNFLVYEDFPVDGRHNAKIIRENLAVWAEKQLAE